MHYGRPAIDSFSWLLIATKPRLFFTTNIPPNEQYMAADKLTRQALWRRIHKVVEHSGLDRITEYPGVEACIHRYDWASDNSQMTL